MSDTREWLDRLYAQSPGWFAVTAFAGGRPRAVKWFATDDLDRASRTIVQTSVRGDVYVSVATHDEPPEDPRSRGGEKSVVSIPGFWADLDIGELGHKPANLPNPPDEQSAMSILDGLPEPSMLMHSGGGLQAYWLFEQPWIFDDAADKLVAKKASADWHNLLEDRGRRLGFHVDKIPSLDRIMRVPGTQNHKAESPRPVAVRRLDGPAWPVAEVASLGMPEDEILAQNGSQAAVEGSSDAPVDDFPLSWDEILLPHGYTPCGENKYARPGKRCSEGHSVTVDPYGVPVLVNFSASDERLPTGGGQRLTKLRVYALLNTGGDMQAAKAALQRTVKTTNEDWAKVAVKFTDTRLDWETLWMIEDTEPDWLIEPFIERGRQVALYSDAKAGKSLVSFEWALTLAFGETWPRDPQWLKERHPNRDPVNVLYIDQENTHQDIRDRGTKMGYRGSVPEHLYYYSFPSLAWLDTDRGGVELHALARHHDANLVIIDTLSRVVEGEENSNDTFNNFYKYSGVRLKADGIALLRLDHEGKDSSRGMRGGSSKKTDVDEIWHMRADGDTLRFERTHSRTHHGEGFVTVSRTDDPVLRHEFQKYRPDPDLGIMRFLMDSGVAENWGWNKTWAKVKDIDGRPSQNDIRRVQARRREEWSMFNEGDDADE